MFSFKSCKLKIKATVFNQVMFVWNRHIMLTLGVSVEDRQTAWLKMTFGGIHRIDLLCYSHISLR